MGGLCVGGVGVVGWVVGYERWWGCLGCVLLSVVLCGGDGGVGGWWRVVECVGGKGFWMFDGVRGWRFGRGGGGDWEIVK